MSITSSFPLRPEQLARESERIDAIAIEMIPETAYGALALRAMISQGIWNYLNSLNYANFNPPFEPGQSVEHVRWDTSYSQKVRPAVVVEIDLTPVLERRLRIRYDDTGDETHINPDVMRAALDAAGKKIFADPDEVRTYTGTEA